MIYLIFLLLILILLFILPSRSLAADVYPNFEELMVHERPEDYEILTQVVPSTTLIMAIHGGGIEAGTSEITEGIAGTEYNYYILDGKKRRNNSTLHITSTRFNEPQAEEMVRNAKRIVSIHGCKDLPNKGDQIVYIGGLDEELKALITEKLRAFGFQAEPAPPYLSGEEERNIANKGWTQAGVQLELTRSLRATFFANVNTRMGRKKKTKRYDTFVRAIREALVEGSNIE